MKFALSICLTFFSMAVFATPYYFSNPYSPYPPGCITTPQLEKALAGDNVVEIWSGEILLAHAYTANKLIPIDLGVYRAGCAEPDRSIILLEFSIPDGSSPNERQFVLPQVVARTDDLFPQAADYPMTLAAEPNSWGFSGNENREVKRIIGDFTEGSSDVSQTRWVYVLDVSAPPLHWEGDYDIYVWNVRFAMSAPRYNDQFELVLPNGIGYNYIAIPPTSSVLDSRQDFELNGRLSGNWVVNGADDQGLMLSFSSIVGRPELAATPQSASTAAPLLVFLSWYTFDAQGKLLWLTGSAEFQAGATEVQVPLVHVSNGGFMSDLEGDRSAAGSVRLKANSCNNIRMDYELNELGLGAGTQTLQRIFALEIVGFPCRDFDARIADLYTDSNRRMQQ